MVSSDFPSVFGMKIFLPLLNLPPLASAPVRGCSDADIKGSIEPSGHIRRFLDKSAPISLNMDWNTIFKCISVETNGVCHIFGLILYKYAAISSLLPSPGRRHFEYIMRSRCFYPGKRNYCLESPLCNS